jgi:Tol biopolymer transport system component
VAFEWAVPGSGQIELRIASTQGTGIPEPRRLFALSLSDAVAITLYDWSPDGRWILASIQTSDLVGQLTLVSAQDGSRQLLKSLTWTGPHRAFFSPDGRYLAYSVPADDTLDESRVFVMAVDGSREHTAVEHPSRNIVMGWAPDGASLLFATNRSGAFGLWSVPIVDGQSRGAARQLRSNIGTSWSLGVTTSGSLLVWKITLARTLQVAPVNLHAESSGRAPAASFQAFLGPGGNPVWSPDGQYLAYQAGTGDEHFNGYNAFTIRRTDGSLVRTLPKRVSYLQQFAWSVDGRALIGTGRDLKGRPGTYRIDIQTGEPTRIGEGLETWTSESAADRTTLANTSLDETKRFFFSLIKPPAISVEYTNNPPSRLIERDLASKAERVLYERPGAGVGPFLSPDGRVLAFGEDAPGEQVSASERRLLVMPATGGTPQELLRGFRRVLWMPDSRALLVVKAPPERQELWVVPIDGSAPRRLGIDVHDNSGQIPYSLRPDGRQIAFVAGDAAPSWSAIWMIENVLPPSTAARESNRASGARSQARGSTASR